MNFEAKVAFQEQILKDPSSVFMLLKPNHIQKIGQLKQHFEQTLLETDALFSLHKFENPLDGSSFAFAIRQYARGFFFNTVILNSKYLECCSLDGLLDTMTHEFQHLIESETLDRKGIYEHASTEKLPEHESKFRNKHPTEKNVAIEDMLFMVNHALISPAIPRYYAEIGSHLFVCKYFDSLRNLAIFPKSDLEKTSGEDYIRDILGRRKIADQQFEELIVFIKQNRKNLKHIPFCDIVFLSLHGLKSLTRGGFYKLGKRYQSFFTRMKMYRENIQMS